MSVFSSDIEPEFIPAALRLLGPARMVLDQVAVILGEHPGQPGYEAAEMAQRIVDWIGHPVTDEPAWATLPCEHNGACGTCRPCKARVRAGYRAGLVDGAPVIAEREDGQA